MTVAWLRMLVAGLSQRSTVPPPTPQDSPCEFRSGQSGIGTGVALSTSVFPSVSFHQDSIFIIYTLLLPEG